MQDLVWILVWGAVIGGAFIWLWRKGQIARLTAYIESTRAELIKCTWPTWEELKGSTLVIAVCIGILGLFTVVVDFVCSLFVRWIT